MDTIRRDLTELQNEGKLIKVHGGALSKSFHQPFQQPAVYARDKKQEIARKALTLIQDGMTILTGGGTVMLELARLIPPELKGTFFTVSPLVALEVAQCSNVEVILIAGKVSPNSYICTGASVIAQLAEIQADICFMGTNGISTDEGLSDFDWEVVQVKKGLIRSSKKLAVMSISEKLETNNKLTICRMNSVDYLLTELDDKNDKLGKYRSQCKVL